MTGSVGRNCKSFKGKKNQDSQETATGWEKINKCFLKNMLSGLDLIFKPSTLSCLICVLFSAYTQTLFPAGFSLPD